MAYLPRPCSPAPLEDDNLLSEILLRLPPQPSSLPRASLVCKRWRRLVSDPAFSRRFRAHHHRNTPILGFFVPYCDGLSFTPTLEPPNRVQLPPRGLRLGAWLWRSDRNYSKILGCRHGLVLIYEARLLQVLVWDPVTGDKRHLDVPPEFANESRVIFNGAVLRCADDIHGGCHSSSSPFQVVLVGTDEESTRALACLYSSKTGMWGNLISTSLPSKDSVSMGIPSTLIGDSLYCLLTGDSISILEFNLDRQSLAVIEVPVDMYAHDIRRFQIVPAEGGGLGFLFLSGFSAQLWKRKTSCNGVASWVLGKTIELDKVLPLSLEQTRGLLGILGFAEDNNMLFLWTIIGAFMVQLESMQLNKRFETASMFSAYYPFPCVYAAGTSQLA